MEGNSKNPLQLISVNHLSLVCGSVEKTMNFYQNVLGFEPIKRPESLDLPGAWLYGFGIGIHLLQSENPEKMQKKRKINPKDSHLSFQCKSMDTLANKLKEMDIDYVGAKIEEGEYHVDQLFFHDPDGFMIEICNCDRIPVVPLASELAKSHSKILNLLLSQKLSQPITEAVPVIASA